MIRAGERAYVKVARGDGTYEYAGQIVEFESDMGGDRSIKIVIDRCDPSPSPKKRPPKKITAKKPPFENYWEEDEDEDEYPDHNETNEETDMQQKYEVEIIRKRETKSVNIYVKVLNPTINTNNEVYLTGGTGPNEERERPEGGEMPIWTTLPNELAEPLIRALAHS